MPDIKSLFDENGYVIIPDLIISQQQARLRDASAAVVAQTRAGQWPHRRVVGRQFPPYGDSELDYWGVQHVMHPDLQQPEFSEYYTSDKLVETVCELMDCKEEELQMELFNILINPVSHEFALRWHRDDVPHDASEDEEKKALALWHHGIQWNTALYEDACLYVVPRSHGTPRTPDQRQHSNTLDAPKDPMDMPGALQVVIKPGETVFYNSNILHCATYNPKVQRATLHACMGSIRGGSSRARNILQHDLNWMVTDPRFKASLDTRGQHMLQNLLDMRKGVKGDVGYSLTK